MPAINRFPDFGLGLLAPLTRIEPVSPDDAADLAEACRAINVAVDGVVRITTTEGVTGDVFITAGIPFPIRATRIWATGTTATGIRALS